MRIYVKVSRDLSSEADKYLLSSTGLRLVPQQERQCYSRGISNSVATDSSLIYLSDPRGERELKGIF